MFVYNTAIQDLAYNKVSHHNFVNLFLLCFFVWSYIRHIDSRKLSICQCCFIIGVEARVVFEWVWMTEAYSLENRRVW